MTQVLASNRWRYIGPASVRGEIYPLGRYRALRLMRSGSARVEGLLVELEDGRDALRRLDAYEGTGDGLYERRRCLARMASGGHRPAWVYVGGRG
jgi:hypothetical protein